MYGEISIIQCGGIKFVYESMYAINTKKVRKHCEDGSDYTINQTRVDEKIGNTILPRSRLPVLCESSVGKIGFMVLSLNYSRPNAEYFSKNNSIHRNEKTVDLP